MDNSKKTFQYVLMGFFIFMLLLAAILFIAVKAKPKDGKNVLVGSIEIWGTLPFNAIGSVASQIATAHKDLKVNYREFPESSFDTTFVEALAAGGGPDLIILPSDDIVKQKNRITVLPVTVYPPALFKSTFVEAGDAFLLPWGVFGVPFAADPLVMYYNRDLLSTNYFVKPADTWEELDIQLPKLVSVDPITGKVNQAAIALGSYKNISAPDDIISSLIMQSGGSLVAFENNRYVSKLRSAGKDVTKIPASDALDFFLSFSDPTKSRYTWSPASTNAREAFLSGALAYYIGYASEYQNLKKRNPNLNFDISLLPQPKGARLKIQKGQVYGIAMVRSTKKQELSLAVMQLFGDAKIVSPALTFLGIAPVTKSALSDIPSDSVSEIIYKSTIVTKSWLVPGRPFISDVFRSLVNDIQSGIGTQSQAISIADAKLMQAYGSLVPPPTQQEQQLQGQQ